MTGNTVHSDSLQNSKAKKFLLNANTYFLFDILHSNTLCMPFSHFHFFNQSIETVA